jgi:hypothetical protein
MRVSSFFKVTRAKRNCPIVADDSKIKLLMNQCHAREKYDMSVALLLADKANGMAQ